MSRRTVLGLGAAGLCGLAVLVLSPTSPVLADGLGTSGFDYRTNAEVQFDLQVLDNRGAPAGGKVIEILEPINDGISPPRVHYTGATNAQGRLQRVIVLPTRLDEVTVRVGVLGINNEAELAIDGSAVSHLFQ